MSTPQRVPLDVYRGDTHRWTLTLWTDPAATAPFDLTDATAKAEIRRPGGGPLLATIETAITLPNTVALLLPAAESAALPGRVAWDLQLTFGDGSVRTAAAGPVTVTADITDALAVPA
jgi:hypothetical protein